MQRVVVTLPLVREDVLPGLPMKLGRELDLVYSSLGRSPSTGMTVVTGDTTRSMFGLMSPVSVA